MDNELTMSRVFNRKRFIAEVKLSVKSVVDVVFSAVGPCCDGAPIFCVVLYSAVLYCLYWLISSV